MANAIVTARFEFSVSVNGSHLEFDPVMARRTVYAKLTVGRTTFWLQRWDTERSSSYKPFAFSSDGLMCWTAGRRQS